MEIGSYVYDTRHLKFETILNYNAIGKKTVLDYHLAIDVLKEEDLQWYSSGSNLNFSLAGFEMQFERHATKYIVEFYLPSGLLVVTSWV